MLNPYILPIPPKARVRRPYFSTCAPHTPTPIYIPTHAVVGIDLGTTFSVAAVNEHGTVRVINDTSGDPLVPSIVSFLPKVRVVILPDL